MHIGIANTLNTYNKVSGGGASVNWSDYNGTNNLSPDTTSLSSYSLNEAKLAKMTDSLVAAVFRDLSSDIYTVVISIDGSGNLTVGTPSAVNLSLVINPSICRLDDTHYLLCYSPSSGSDNVYGRVITISGTTITNVGAENQLSSVSGSLIGVAAISSTSAACIYEDGTDNSTDIVHLTISGDTITEATPVEVTSANQLGTAIIALSSTRYLVVTSSSTGIEVEGTLWSISGTTPVKEDTLTIADTTLNAQYPAIARIDDNNAVVCYTDDNNSKVYSCVITNSSDTLSKGSIIEAFTASSDIRSLSASCPDSTHVLIVAGNGSNPWYGNSIVLDISEATLTPNTL